MKNDKSESKLFSCVAHTRRNFSTILGDLKKLDQFLLLDLSCVLSQHQEMKPEFGEQ